MIFLIFQWHPAVATHVYITGHVTLLEVLTDVSVCLVTMEQDVNVRFTSLSLLCVFTVPVYVVFNISLIFGLMNKVILLFPYLLQEFPSYRPLCKGISISYLFFFSAYPAKQNLITLSRNRYCIFQLCTSYFGCWSRLISGFHTVHRGLWHIWIFWHKDTYL